MNRAAIRSWFILLSIIFLGGFTSLAEDKPAGRDKPRTIVNSLGMTLVEILPGEFEMGEPDYRRVADHHRTSVQVGQGLEVDRPSIPVKLTGIYWIGAHEVTVGQFRAFVEATEYRTEAERDGRGAFVLQADVKNEVDRFVPKPEHSWRDPGYVQHDNHPVVCVSWHDAQAFCTWLTEREQTLLPLGEGGRRPDEGLPATDKPSPGSLRLPPSPSGRGIYRLPTEAEWEFACRAGTTTIYSCGDDPDRVYEHGNVGDAALERTLPGIVSRQRVDRLGPDDGDGFAYTAPVGRYRPNPWGLYDMHGNVWEWCRDRYQDRYYAALQTELQALRRAGKPVFAIDPQGPETTPQHQYGDWRSLRGGSWYTSPISCRSASRSFAEARDASCYTGFRVVRETVSTKRGQND